ncbi:MAG: ABC transporter permease, partial [Bacteroidota bacterium]
MFINHLKIAFRQILRYKFFSGLNILGLSLGMAVVLLIGLFIYQEYQYDRWMDESEDTYRVVRKRFGGGTAWTPSLLAQKLEQDYPEVAQASGFSSAGEQLLSYAGNDLYIEHTAQVDSTFFQVLKMEFEVGNPATVLDAPNNMVITDRLAEKVFGNTNPIGEIVAYGGGELFTITGLINTKAGPTHIPSDIFTRFTWYGNFWSGNNRLTYVRLKSKAGPDQLAQKIDAEVNAIIEREYRADGYIPNKDDFFKWTLQPLNEVYLQSEGFTSILYAKGSQRRVYILALIALLILAVAVVNYVNLSTARASQRGREVGVKKVTGAGRGLLATQFITESVVQALIASGFALLIAELTLPTFNRIMDRELLLLGDFSIILIPILLGLAILIGLLAGAYPAFVMSAFKPVTALKAKFLKNGEKSIFRKVLVTGQFTVSITLLIVMAFIYR